MNSTMPSYLDKNINMDVHPFSSVLSSREAMHTQWFNNTVVKWSVFIVLLYWAKFYKNREGI